MTTLILYYAFLSSAIENLGMVMGPIGQTRVKKTHPTSHVTRVGAFRHSDDANVDVTNVGVGVSDKKGF